MAGQAKKAGVMGWPVSHSKSPILHDYWMRLYGINGSYTRLPVKPEDLAAELRSLPGRGFVGVNLTVPHKEEALHHLDKVDDTARQIGAVNTVIVTPDGKLHGTNTDAYGFITNLQTNARHYNPTMPAVVLGAGGAARAICAALVGVGYPEIRVLNRTRTRGEALAQAFGKTLRVLDWQDRSRSLADAGLLVNTTTQGMIGQAALEIDLSALPAHAVVNDLVYAPLETALLAAARARGLEAVDGLGMLLYQAQLAFEGWFGIKPEVTPALRAHVLGNG